MGRIACLLCFGLLIVSEAAYYNRPPRRDCLGESIGQNGIGTCAGIYGKQCPQPTDMCLYQPGSTAGKCCLGCEKGFPYPGIKCGGCFGPRCPSGYSCHFSRYIADATGVCCRQPGVNKMGYKIAGFK